MKTKIHHYISEEKDNFIRILQVTSWVVHLAPIGVCFLIAGEILHMKSVLAELTKLAWYMFSLALLMSFIWSLSVSWGHCVFPGDLWCVLAYFYVFCSQCFPFRFL